MSLLKDRAFHECCKVLKVTDQSPNDPDRRTIEKAFRKLALKTHPDKGGDPTEFKRINDAYNRLITHITKLEIIECEKDLADTSVIIEISKQSLPKWYERLKVYGPPKTSSVKNTLFQGPYKQYKGRGRVIGPITLVLYEDPEDKIPKIHCRCENYMAWIQEQKLPLHLHVNKDKKIMFDQWRIMSVAEFGFCSSIHVRGASSESAFNDWSTEFDSKNRSQKPQEDKEAEQRRKAEELAAAKLKAEREEEERRKKQEEEEEAKRLAAEEEAKKPWWNKYADKYCIGETTPPPEDLCDNSSADFPKVFSMTSNSFNSYSKSSNGTSSSEPPKKAPRKEPPSPEIPEEIQNSKSKPDDVLLKPDKLEKKPPVSPTPIRKKAKEPHKKESETLKSDSTLPKESEERATTNPVDSHSKTTSNTPINDNGESQFSAPLPARGQKDLKDRPERSKESPQVQAQPDIQPNESPEESHISVKPAEPRVDKSAIDRPEEASPTKVTPDSNGPETDSVQPKPRLTPKAPPKKKSSINGGVKKPKNVKASRKPTLKTAETSETTKATEPPPTFTKDILCLHFAEMKDLRDDDFNFPTECYARKSSAPQYAIATIVSSIMISLTGITAIFSKVYYESKPNPPSRGGSRKTSVDLSLSGIHLPPKSNSRRPSKVTLDFDELPKSRRSSVTQGSYDSRRSSILSDDISRKVLNETEQLSPPRRGSTVKDPPEVYRRTYDSTSSVTTSPQLPRRTFRYRSESPVFRDLHSGISNSSPQNSAGLHPSTVNVKSEEKFKIPSRYLRRMNRGRDPSKEGARLNRPSDFFPPKNEDYSNLYDKIRKAKEEHKAMFEQSTRPRGLSNGWRLGSVGKICH